MQKISAMNGHNDGISESNALQNQFTAYLITAIHRRKLQYIQDIARKQKYEHPFDYCQNLEDSALEDEVTKKLPMAEQLENENLYKALSKTRERDLKILYMKVLEERSFVEIADEIGIGYNAAKAIYYRLIEKIKSEFGDEKK